MKLKRRYLNHVIVRLPGTVERNVRMRRLERNQVLSFPFFPDVDIQRRKQQVIGGDLVVEAIRRVFSRNGEIITKYETDKRRSYRSSDDVTANERICTRR